LSAWVRKQSAILKKKGEYYLSIDHQEVLITLEDIEIISDDIPGLQVAVMGALTVALDTTITRFSWKKALPVN